MAALCFRTIRGFWHLPNGSVDKMQLVKVVVVVLFSNLEAINSVVIQLAKVLRPADIDLKT